jgi:2-iminoacetate synthase
LENKNFIDEELIHSKIESSNVPDKKLVREILDKALELKGLNFDDAASLLNIENQDDLDALFETALKVKEEIYGNRIAIFAPLYVANYCSNNCLYCGFRMDNQEIERSALTLEQVRDEAQAILEQGHKRSLMLMGENHKMSSLDYFIDCIDAAYSAKDSKGSSLRRINVEIMPLSDEEFQRLAKVKIGTYTVFQETYHRDTYKYMHPSGKKSDYEWRLSVMDRALKNGLNDVGVGALFGLYDYRFETLGLLAHANHLDKEYGVGPHTISIPRIRAAQNAPASHDLKYAVDDLNFQKIVAVLRLSVPYTGMILSTRESIEMRTKLLQLGISQLSAGSKTSIGGYKQAMNHADADIDIGQFSLNDCRSSGEVIQSLIEQGFVPSFCTGCYRLGRVGADFMDLAKPGLIKMHCLPNALTTLKEFLVDYADDNLKKIGEELIATELNNVPGDARQAKTREYLNRIASGERDLYF